MKPRLPLLFLLLLCVLGFNSHAQTFKWANALKDSSGIVPQPEIVIDHHHDIISTAQFQQVIHIGSHRIAASGNNRDCYIVKHDSSGNVLWTNSIVASGSSFLSTVKAVAIAVDASDNIYIGGTFSDAATFSSAVSISYSGHSTNGGSFIAKYNASGSLLWVKPLNGAITCTALSIDASGNIICSGTYSDSVRFGSSLIPNDSSLFHFFVAKYDSTASLTWMTSSASVYLSTASSSVLGDRSIKKMLIDASGNIYAVGYFAGSIAFGTDTIHNPIPADSGHQVLVAKFNPSGTLLWHRTEGAYNGYNQAYDVTMDSKGDIYVCGELADSGYTLLHESEKSFLAKYSSTGTKLWLRKYGTTGTSNGIYAVAIDNRDAIYIAGNYIDSIRFDTAHFASVQTNIFITQLNTMGDPVWAKTMRGPGGNICNMDIDKNAERIAITGVFHGDDTLGTIPIDNNHASYYAPFVTYLSIYNGGNGQNVAATPPAEQMTIYPNPATDKVYIRNAIPNSIVNIYNVSGQAVYFGRLNSTQQAINISGLVNGMYFVKMVTPEGIVQTKTFVRE